MYISSSDVSPANQIVADNCEISKSCYFQETSGHGSCGCKSNAQNIQPPLMPFSNAQTSDACKDACATIEKCGAFNFDGASKECSLLFAKPTCELVGNGNNDAMCVTKHGIKHMKTCSRGQVAVHHVNDHKKCGGVSEWDLVCNCVDSSDPCLQDGGCVHEPRCSELPALSNGHRGNDAENIQRCAGDCHSDCQCAPGLKCFQRDAYEAVPGCSGAGQERWDYCYDPNPTPEKCECKQSWEWEGVEFSGCSFTPGKRAWCYTTEDNCVGSDAVFANENIPGVQESGVSYCISESLVGSSVVVGDFNHTFIIDSIDEANKQATVKLIDGYSYRPVYDWGLLRGPSFATTGGTADNSKDPIPLSGEDDATAVNLQRCVGDCDADCQCAVGLKCFQRDDFDAVPGCSGQGQINMDYCYDPNPTTPGTPPQKCECKESWTWNGVAYSGCQSTPDFPDHLFCITTAESATDCAGTESLADNPEGDGHWTRCNAAPITTLTTTTGTATAVTTTTVTTTIPAATMTSATTSKTVTVTSPTTSAADAKATIDPPDDDTVIDGNDNTTTNPDSPLDPNVEVGAVTEPPQEPADGAASTTTNKSDATGGGGAAAIRQQQPSAAFSAASFSFFLLQSHS